MVCGTHLVCNVKNDILFEQMHHLKKKMGSPVSKNTCHVEARVKMKCWMKCSNGRSMLHVPFECGSLPYHLQMQSSNYMHRDCNAPLFLASSFVTHVMLGVKKFFCMCQRHGKDVSVLLVFSLSLMLCLSRYP